MPRLRSCGRGGALALMLVTFASVMSCAPAPTEPTRLKAIELGTAVDADGRVTAPTREFSPQGMVYASIETDGGGPATLHVRWYDGNRELVKEESKAIDPRKPSHYVFQYAAPKGWPPGKSYVVFWLNDAEKHTAEFQAG